MTGGTDAVAEMISTALSTPGFEIIF